MYRKMHIKIISANTLCDPNNINLKITSLINNTIPEKHQSKIFQVLKSIKKKKQPNNTDPTMLSST